MNRTICILLVIFSIGCGKDEDPTLSTDGTIRFMLKGVEQVSTSITANMKRSSSQVPNELAIIAEFSGTATIPFSVSTNNIYVDLGVGEYLAKGNNPSISPVNFYYIPTDGKGSFNSAAFPNDIAGKVIITELDTTNKVFSGTFEINVTRGLESLNLASGSFKKIPYKE